ncbi:MAG: hypothetical protein HC908_04995 [Calothrix sp. SM1_7_51]|nr:hypothetical protein [Calothrix sp. SM1_7_51]
MLRVASDATLSQVVVLMAESQKHCVLAISLSKIVGFLTAENIVQLTAKGVDFTKTQISEVVNPSVVTLKQSKIKDTISLFSVLRLSELSLLVIIDEQDQVVGLLTKESFSKGLLQKAEIYPPVEESGVTDRLETGLETELVTFSPSCNTCK